MKISRNDPCPFGSGKKYKKCCQSQDQKQASEALKQKAEQDRNSYAEEVAFIDELTKLNDMSNEVVDLVNAEKWDEAYRACERLKEQFPDEIDADQRFSMYYEYRGDFAKARDHVQHALEIAQADPDKYPKELVESLQTDVKYLDDCHKAGRKLDYPG